MNTESSEDGNQQVFSRGTEGINGDGVKGERQEQTGLLADGWSSCLFSVSACMCASAPAVENGDPPYVYSCLFLLLFISVSREARVSFALPAIKKVCSKTVA